MTLWLKTWCITVGDIIREAACKICLHRHHSIFVVCCSQLFAIVGVIDFEILFKESANKISKLFIDHHFCTCGQFYGWPTACGRFILFKRNQFWKLIPILLLNYYKEELVNIKITNIVSKINLLCKVKKKLTIEKAIWVKL